MDNLNSTCWDLLALCGKGDSEARDAFVLRYAPLIRRYLGSRWRHGPCVQDIDDAIQEVFLQCLKPFGVIENADPQREGGFRAYFYGVIRNVEFAFDKKRRDVQPESASMLDRVEADESTHSQAYDRAWAEMILRQTKLRMVAEALAEGCSGRQRRIELLEIVAQNKMTLVQVAESWGISKRAAYSERNVST